MPPPMSLNDYLRTVVERDVRARIEARTLPQFAWRMWRRFERSGDDATLAVLWIALGEYDHLRLGTWFCQRLMRELRDERDALGGPAILLPR